MITHHNEVGSQVVVQVASRDKVSLWPIGFYVRGNETARTLFGEECGRLPTLGDKNAWYILVAPIFNGQVFRAGQNRGETRIGSMVLKIGIPEIAIEP